MKWVCVLLAATVLFASSCSPQASVNSIVETTVEPTALPSIQLFPFNFRTEEVEDGWNIGYVRLYFINPASQAVRPSTITISSVEVTTAENRDYSGELFTYTDAVKLRGNGYGSGIRQLSLPAQIRVTNTLGIPPQLPIVVRSSEFGGGGEYVIQFRYARAATPTSVVLNTSLGQLTFDLSEIAQDLPEPSPPSRLVQEMSDFASNFDFEDENINLEFETNCFVLGPNGFGQRRFGIRYTIQNLDAFDERKYERTVDTAIYYASGALTEWLSQPLVNEALGPSQSENDYFGFAHYVEEGEQPLYFIYYANSDDARIYPIDDCTEGN